MIGAARGPAFYTLGQRQGLGIGGVKDKGAQRGGGEHAPWFVARKDIETNTLWVVQGHDHPWLLSHRAAGRRRELGRRQRARAGRVGGQDPLPPGRRAVPAGARARTARFALDFPSRSGR